MTPYKRCEAKSHTRDRHSPDGIQIIETCETCLLQWVMPTVFSEPSEGPITIHNSSFFKQGDNK